MMSLFSDPNDRQWEWQAYVSSALTLQDAQTGDRIKAVNKLIKEWLENETGTFAYLPQEYSDPSRSDKMKPEEIYVLDRWRIAEADFVVMNMDQPAFGVGQEAEMACAMGIPIIAFHYAGNVLPSRIIRGVPAIYAGEGDYQPSDAVIRYKDQLHYDDLRTELIANVRKLQKSAKPLSATTYSLQSFSDRLRAAIINSGKREAQVAREAGFTEAFLHYLLTDYRSIVSTFEPYGLLKLCKLRRIPFDRYLNPGLWVLNRLADVLDVRISSLIGEDELNRIWHEPLISLSRKGVSLEEFLEVSEGADYIVLYQKAARSRDEESSSEQVAEEILAIVESHRDELARQKPLF
jgi:nucleoside 2-deoxyribosyltransferase